MPGPLYLYTITHRPADLPGAEYAVREFTVTNTKSGGVTPGPLLGMADTLEKARALVPAWADARLLRLAGDDPVIVETWL